MTDILITDEDSLIILEGADDLDAAIDFAETLVPMPASLSPFIFLYSESKQLIFQSKQTRVCRSWNWSWEEGSEGWSEDWE